MLTKQTPDTVKASLTVKAQGVDNTLLVTYHNHSHENYAAFVENPENLKVPDDVDPRNEKLAIAHVNASIVLFCVKSFDDGTDTAFPLNRAGMIDLEYTWPGTLMGLWKGYHQARAASIEKN